MFTYYFIDNYNIPLPMEYAYNRDLSYLKSLVEQGKYKQLIICTRFF